MRKITDPSQVKNWSYFDQRLGRGFTGTRDSIVMQVQQAYLAANLAFREQEIPAMVDNFMCEQGLASPCVDRIEGLGDLVQIALKPFVKTYDQMMGTHIAGCPACAKRRDALNHAVPL